MRCLYAVASPTTMWYRSSGCIPLENTHSLLFSSLWKTSTSSGILEITAIPGGLTWYVFHHHPTPRRCLTHISASAAGNSPRSEGHALPRYHPWEP